MRVPRASKADLYRRMSRKRTEIEGAGGTFVVVRSKRKAKHRMETWSHLRHPGRVKVMESAAGTVLAEIGFEAGSDGRAELFGAFTAWLDRHFRDDVAAISIHYTG